MAPAAKPEPAAYAYAAADTRGLAEELEEWFQYSAGERAVLAGRGAGRRRGWTARRSTACRPRRPSAAGSTCRRCTRRRWRELVADVRAGADGRAVVDGLEGVAYLVLGAWAETAGAAAVPDPEEEPDFEPRTRSICGRWRSCGAFGRMRRCSVGSEQQRRHTRCCEEFAAAKSTFYIRNSEPLLIVCIELITGTSRNRSFP